MKNKIANIIVIFSLTLATISANAISFLGDWTVHKNDSGHNITYLVPKNNNFCFLTRVEFEDTDTKNEYARCRIYETVGYWWLEAKLGKSSDADARCTAMCYSY